MLEHQAATVAETVKRERGGAFCLAPQQHQCEGQFMGFIAKVSFSTSQQNMFSCTSCRWQ